MNTEDLAPDRLLAPDAATVMIDHAPVPADDVIDGRPTMGAATLLAHGGVEIGVWEITTGVVQDVEADEVFVVLSGRGRMGLADGGSVDLTAGTVVHLRAGDRTRWTIEETLRKIYVLLPAQPATHAS